MGVGGYDDAGGSSWKSYVSHKLVFLSMPLGGGKGAKRSRIAPGGGTNNAIIYRSVDDKHRVQSEPSWISAIGSAKDRC